MTSTGLEHERDFVEHLALAALAVRYERPPRDKIAATERALAPLVAEWQKAPRREADRIARQLESQKEKASEERTKLQSEVTRLDADLEAAIQRAEAAEQTARELRATLSEVQGQLRDVESAADEARELARAVWRVLPAESKLALFESDTGWVPKWIAQPPRAATW